MFEAWFAGEAYAAHRHDTYAIGVTERGLQSFGYRGRQETSGPGNVIVLHPDELHDGHAGGDDGFKYRIVYIDPALIAQATEAIVGHPRSLPFVRTPVCDNAILIEAIGAAFDDDGTALAGDAVIFRFAEGLLSAAGTETGMAGTRAHDERALRRGRDLLLSARHRSVRSDELERVTDLSRFAFARQFKQRFGTSPYRFMLMRRLDTARRMIDDGAPLAEVAAATGFADQPHLTRHFRRAYGVTPGRYRQLVLQNSAIGPMMR